MDIAKLKTLIDSDPANATKSDQEVLDWCNTSSIAAEHETLTGSELLSSTDGTELSALSNTAAQSWLALCGVDNVPVQNGGAAAKLATSIFGVSSATITSLVTARDYTKTPVESAGLSKARMGYIIEARAL